MSATMSDSAEESPVYEPTPNSQEDARSTHRSRSHRTRQPPNALSYYSLGQPVSSQARISNVNSAVQPMPQFAYRLTVMQIQKQYSGFVPSAFFISWIFSGICAAETFRTVPIARTI